MKLFPLLILIGLLLSSAVSLGDTLTGEIQGQVVDVESGLPLPGVRVALTSTDRGWLKEVTTDQYGRYHFFQLEPGDYTVQAVMEGYYGSTRTNILIRLNRLKVVVPPFELRRTVTTPTRQIVLRGEQAKTAIIDLSAPGPTPVILAITEEAGLTSLASMSEWGLSFNFDSLVIQSLPLRSGRSFDQLAFFSPGVFRVPFSGGDGPAVGIGVGTAGQFSVNGSRGRSNNFTVDGSDNNDEDIGVRRQGFVSLVPQSAESVEEFQVVTVGPSAEFGRNAGAMVNAVSRSGQLKVHGNLLGILGPSGLAARDPFSTPFSDSLNSAPLDGGQFAAEERRDWLTGGVLGGPIVPEKLYYFGSFETRSYRSNRVGHFVVPGPVERGLRTAEGFVPIGQLGEFFQDRGIEYSDAAGAGVFSLYPLPNNPSGPFGEHNYSQARRAEGDGIVASGKVDWYPTPIHSFTSRYNITDDDSTLPFTGEAFNSTLETRSRTQNLSLYVNSSGEELANTLRVSYGRTALDFPVSGSSPLLFGSEPAGEGFLATDRLNLPYGSFGPFGVTGPIGQLRIEPYSGAGIDVFNFPQGRVDNTYQISDTISREWARHSLKFGIDLRRSELNSFSDRNSRPLVVFAPGYISGSCQASPSCLFATDDGLLSGTDAASIGAPAGMLQTLSTQNIPDSTLGLAFTRTDLFVQDSWSVTQNLVLNLGIRYEYQTVPGDGQGRIEGNFGLSPEDFSRLEPSGSPSDQAIIRSGNQAFDRALEGWNRFLDGRSAIYVPDRDNWSPRLGFAWNPDGAHRMVVRGGWTMLYDATLGAVTSRSRSVFPTFVPVNFDLNFQWVGSGYSGLGSAGRYLGSTLFYDFAPTGEPLVTPGTLNRFNLGEDAFATALGTLFAQAPPFPGASLSSNGLAFTLPEKRLKTASAHHLYLSVERQLGRDFLVAGRYVGTRGLHLTRFMTPNAGTIATPVLFSSPLVGPLVPLSLPPGSEPGTIGRPVTELGSYTVFSNSASSEYHSLQVSLEKRWSRGLQFQVNWTWSHALDEVSDPFPGRGFSALPQVTRQPGLDWASANFDVRHRVAGFLIWEPAFTSLPLRNWRFSWSFEAQGGQPFTIRSALDRNLDGNLTDRPDTIKGIIVTADPRRPIRLDEGVAPLELLAVRGQNGQVQRNAFRGDGIALVDLSVNRAVQLGENISLDLRADLFNLFNIQNFGTPDRVLESPGFGSSFDTLADPRTVRLMARLNF